MRVRTTSRGREMASRKAHNLEIGGSSPPPATKRALGVARSNTSPCHGEDRRFKSGSARQNKTTLGSPPSGLVGSAGAAGRDSVRVVTAAGAGSTDSSGCVSTTEDWSRGCDRRFVSIRPTMTTATSRVATRAPRTSQTARPRSSSTVNRRGERRRFCAQRKAATATRRITPIVSSSILSVGPTYQKTAIATMIPAITPRVATSCVGVPESLKRAERILRRRQSSTARAVSTAAPTSQSPRLVSFHLTAT
jgi:hypothetical protein